MLGKGDVFSAKDKVFAKERVHLELLRLNRLKIRRKFTH